MKDIVGLKEGTVVACLGLGCKKLFNDGNIYGVKGHLVELKNTTGWRGVYGF